MLQAPKLPERSLQESFPVNWYYSFVQVLSFKSTSPVSLQLNFGVPIRELIGGESMVFFPVNLSGSGQPKMSGKEQVGRSVCASYN